MRRFSLLNLLLVLTSIACGFIAWTNATKLSKAHLEISQLRARLGELDVNDKSQLHIVNIDAVRPKYRWQVFVPKDAA